MLKSYVCTSVRTVLLLLLIFGTSLATVNAHIEPAEIYTYVENEERLFEIVSNFVDKQWRKGSLSRSEIRKFERLLKKEKVNDQKLMAQILREMNGVSIDHEPQYVVVDGVIREIEDTVVSLGTRFGDIEEDPAAFSVGDIKYMRGIRASANRYYRDGEYDKAFPLLLGLAKRGFKDAQSRLAYIFFTGTEEVEKSNLRALGWLGSAAHGRTEPAFKVLFNKYMREVPDHVRPTVDQVVSAYQAQYSHSEHLDCSIEHPYAKGVVKRTYCRFKLEAIADAQNAQGITRSWVDKVNTAE